MTENSQYDCRAELRRYLAGELTPAEAEAFARRAAADPDLRAVWAEFQVSRHLDGEIGEAELAKLTEGVWPASRLQQIVGNYRTLAAKLAPLADDRLTVDDDLQRQAILAAASAGRRQRRLLRPVWIAAAAAAVLVLAFGVYLFVRPTTVSPPEARMAWTAPAEVGGTAQMTIRPSRAYSVRRGGSIVVAVRTTPRPALAQGMSLYMMLAAGSTETPGLALRLPGGWRVCFFAAAEPER
jgi:hypothetical protein